MRHLIVVLISIFFLADNGLAQIQVVKSANQKLCIDFSGLRPATDDASRTFAQTLENDLRNSSWFNPLRGNGELRLIGTIHQTGGKLKAVCQIYRRCDQERLFSKSYRMDADCARTLAHRVADEIVVAITGHKGIASSRIALVGLRNGVKELYLCDSDGGELTQLTHDGRIIVGPNWSPDGDSVIYTSFLRGFPDVYRLDLRRGKRKLLASYSGLNTGAVLSPNGKEMALILSKDGNPELYIKNLRSEQLIRLTFTTRVTEASPSWSPDGKNLVYVSDQSGRPQLYLIAREGGRPRRLSSRGVENVAPDWGSNDLIACASRSGGHYAIAIIQPTTGQTRYLQTDRADYEDPSWAPDGRHLFATRTAANYQSSLYLLDIVCDAPVALLTSGGDWYSPACSPK